jgi:DNA-binding transcriptional MerR regulator
MIRPSVRLSALTAKHRRLTLESTPDCTLGMRAKTVNHAARIGQVAHETGISIDTIRFYEKQGLLKRSPRTEGGFRLFGAGDIETLKFVRKAQELGFSLKEIRELLMLRAEHVPACSHVKELLEQKLNSVGGENHRITKPGAEPQGRAPEMQARAQNDNSGT